MKTALLTTMLALLAVQLTAQTITSSNLPLIVLDTHGQPIYDDPKITADMGIIYNGPGVRNGINDPFNHYNGKIGIEIRGNSSQQFPMKSYSVELRDNAGNNKEQSLFGLPKESDWVLYAPYTDKTLMRNFLGYTFAREMGYWSSHCQFVELVINGEYIGIYVFLEKIKRGSGRVNISKTTATDISGDAVTGGYIFAIDGENQGWYSSYPPPFATNGQRIRFNHIYPKETAIVPEQQVWLKSYVDSFETALHGPEFQDKEKGWRHFADEGSFADFFIINELSRAVDGYHLSAYFHKDRHSKGGKIHAGPVWDFDLAFNNANYCRGSDIEGWAYDFNSSCYDDVALAPFWWYRLQEDVSFQKVVGCRWRQLRQTTLSDARIHTLIDSVAALTAEARTRHFVKWPILGEYIWPNTFPIPANYEEEITSLKNWMARRMAWLTQTLDNTGTCGATPPPVVSTLSVELYPNPVTNTVSLIIKSPEAQSLHISITDALGRRVTIENYSLTYGNNTMLLSSTRWAAGMYFLNWESGKGERGTIKLVKKGNE